MKEELDENKPTAKKMELPEEFIYAIRIVDMAKKVNLKKDCDCDDLVRVIAKSFGEYKNKILKEIEK